MKTPVSARILAPLLVGALAFSSCGDPAPESIAFVDDTPALSEPDLEHFSDDELMLIDFQSDWLCELERRTFSTLDETDELLEEVLRAAGIDAVTYETFVRETLARQDVRDAVLFGLLERCRT